MLAASDRGVKPVAHYGATFKTGSLTLALSTAVPLRNDGRGGVSAEFMRSEGKSQVRILRDDCNEGGVPCPPSEEDTAKARVTLTIAKNVFHS
jgi:hypothetical protein